MNDDQVSLDKFGRFVMEHLRDHAIDDVDRLAAAGWKASSVQALQNELVGLTEQQRAVVRRSVITCVDSAIHAFLFHLQERADFENDLQVLVDGKNVAMLSDGIHGEPFGEDGWQARFSKYGQGPDQA
jgi:hypothetical protein